MKTILKLVLLGLLGGSNLFAAKSEEVISLVDKAYSYCEIEGLDSCIKAFNSKDPKFTKNDLYVFVSKFSGVVLAHGGNKVLVGKDLSKVKSPSGIYPGIEMRKIAQEKGLGWLEYRWSHPITKRVAEKRTYIRRFQKKEIFIASGYYK